MTRQKTLTDLVHRHLIVLLALERTNALFYFIFLNIRNQLSSSPHSVKAEGSLFSLYFNVGKYLMLLVQFMNLNHWLAFLAYIYS